MTEYFVVEPCASSNGFEIKLQGKKIDLEKAEQAVAQLGSTVASSPVVLLAKIQDYSITFIKKEDIETIKKEEITDLANDLRDVFERGGAIYENRLSHPY